MQYKWLRAVILGVVLFTSGCSLNGKEIQPVEVGFRQAEDVPFVEGSGRSTIVYQDERIINIIVLAKELNPEGEYSIHLIRDKQGGLIFGPEANMKIQFGKMVGDTLFQPNEQGELLVSMINPERMLAGANEIILTINENNEEIMRSAPFILAQ